MKRFIYLMLALMMVRCRERYNVPLSSPQTNYLVVEGMINPAGMTTIALSRTTGLENRQIQREYNARVQIEGEDNSLYDLSAADTGQYVSENLVLNPATRYRLHIVTNAQKEYVSEYKAPLYTPGIDSISWKPGNGIDIFVNAHDNNRGIQYYKWDYDETWEFHSSFRTQMKFLPHYEDRYLLYMDVGYYDHGRYDDSLYVCWQSRKSSLVNIASTAGLSGNVVYKLIKSYPDTAIEMSVLYSINVRQYGLSKEGFGFFQKLKKNTESLGSIFDAQPSDIKGNILCMSDPQEKVIGYVEVSAPRELRKFISNSELPGWKYDPGCDLPQTFNYNIDTATDVYRHGLYPVDGLSVMGGLVQFTAAKKECVVCTLFGTNTKPAFWPQ